LSVENIEIIIQAVQGLLKQSFSVTQQYIPQFVHPEYDVGVGGGAVM